MKRLLLILALVVLASTMLAGGCSKPAPTTTPAPVPGQTPAATPSAPEAPIKIGHIRPLTGHMAISGERMIRSGAFALEQLGSEVAGRPVEIVVADSGASPAMAVDAAKKLVELDDVAMIIGPTVGGTQMAVSAYMSAVGRPLLFTNPAPLGVIFEGHQWTFMCGGTEPQNSSPMGVYAYEELGYRKVTVITGDWMPGHGFMDAFMGAFKAKGGEVIQEQYPPFDNTDFGAYLSNLKDADAVVAWFDGTTAIRFLTQFQEFGIRKRMPLIADFHGSFFSPYILYQLPPAAAEAMIGEKCPTPYSPLLDTVVNDKFVADFEARFGELPDETDSGPYEGFLIAMAALEATGGDTSPEALRDALLAVKLESPQGMISFDPGTKAAIKPSYISAIEKQGDNYVWDPVFTYKDVPPPFGFSPPPPPPPGAH